MKKLFALLLALTMMAGLFSFASAEEIDPDVIEAAQDPVSAAEHRRGAHQD